MATKVLVVGGGGREHALAWKLWRAPSVAKVFVAPGSGGTDDDNVAIPVTDLEGLLAFAQASEIDLTVVGPEAPLGEGIVDRFTEAGLRCFGPTAAAAQLEISKAFSKDFMSRHGIPTAEYRVFKDVAEARAFLGEAPWPVVIKASGLAAGKGVLLPESVEEAHAALDSLMVSRDFGEAGDEVIIEERLIGEEVSVLALCDGHRAVPLVPARDHKRALDGDRGLNTGGMGAYAPTPALDAEALDAVTREVLQATVEGMSAEGCPYVGVLYAGLMLTAAGPRVLEFNCRFGDPETQVVLPLLDVDLAEVMGACIDGALTSEMVRRHEGAAATVVMASEGYPRAYPKGRAITGVEDAEALPGVVVFQAGTRRGDDGALLTSGGRVLAVTGRGASLEEAIARAYAGVEAIDFEGAHYRRDIGGHVRDGQGEG